MSHQNYVVILIVTHELHQETIFPIEFIYFSAKKYYQCV